MKDGFRFVGLCLALLVLLAISGCGDGGGGTISSAPPGAVLSGSAVKGPFQKGGKVEVFKVDSNGSLITPAAWKGTIESNDGKFSIDVGDYQGVVEIQVSGAYLDEATGSTITTSEPLKCVEYVSGSTSANVNIVTHLASEKIKNYMKKGYTPEEAISAAQAEIALLLEEVIGEKKPKELNPLKISVPENANLLLLSYALQKIGGEYTVKLLDYLAENIKDEGNLDWELTEEQKAGLASTALTPVTLQLNEWANAFADDYTNVFNSLKNITGFEGSLDDLKNLKLTLKSFSKLSSIGLAKLAGSEVYVNLDQKPLGTTALALKEEEGKVIAELNSPDFTYGFVSTEKGKDAYMFVQPVDKNKTKLELPEGELTCEGCEEELGGLKAISLPSGMDKPVPKTLSSSDATTKVIVSNMKLKKDITVAVTPYKSNKFIPKFDSIATDTGLKDPIVISGADIKIVDSLGKPTTSEKACFCASISIQTTHIIQGSMGINQLATKLNAGDGSLYLLVFKDKKWQIVNGAGFVLSGNSLNQTSGKTLRLYPFVIVYVPKEGTAFSGKISGTVTEAGGLTPVKGALVTIEGQEIFAVTGPDGAYTLAYSALKANEPVQFTLTFTKTGYSKVASSVSVSSANPNVTKDAQLEKVETFTLKGKVTGDEGASIPNAHLTLYYDSLEFDTLTDASGNYSFELVPVEKKDTLSIVVEAFGFEKKQLKVQGNIEDGKLIYNIGLTKKVVMLPTIYKEGFETELTEKKWTFTNYSSLVGWQVVKKPEQIKVAEQIVDQILFPDRATVDVIGKVVSLYGVQGYGGTCETYPIWPIEQPPTPESPAIPQNVKLTPTNAGFGISWDPVEGVYEYLITVTDGVTSVSFPLFPQYESSGYIISGPISDWQEYTKTLNITNGKVYQVGVKSMQFKQPEDGLTSQEAWVFSNYSDIKCVMPILPSKVAIAFNKVGENTETIVYAKGVDLNGDGVFDSVETDFEDFNAAQYQFEIQGPVLIKKDVSVSYPDPKNKIITLLPAYEGDHVLWYGNKENGTISDQNSNTSSTSNYGFASGPILDLTGFNNVTALMHTWFEVESVDVAKKQYDLMEIQVAIYDEDKAEGDPITIWASGVEYTLLNKIFYTLVSLNPDKEPPGMQLPYINYSSGGVNAVPIWIQKELNLTPFAGHKIKIGFYFDTKDKMYNGFRGWALDNLLITDEKSSQPFVFEGYVEPDEVAIYSKAVPDRGN